MSLLIFHRESNNFKDILEDKVIKKSIRTKVKFSEYLILELNDDKDTAYAMLKYGDDVIDVTHVFPDFSPVMDRDYSPDRNNGYWRKRSKG